MPALSSLAVTSRLLLRRLSAWALPRPSAMASAKLANRQVNQSQRQIWRLKPENFPGRNRKIVVQIEPT